jgi:putative exosortase-affiliated protein, TIGR04073 family
MAARKIALFVLVAMLVLSLTASESFAASGPLKKLSRGAANIFTCFFELPSQMYKQYTRDGFFSMASYGVVKGLSLVVVRAAVGVYEVATFPVPIPSEYEPILTEPEFMLDDFQT